ncbi:hypothetical protein NDU88_001784 [Pleurodeles waltl]|uniref:Uncharacterized protein n=1 Tax=Pleurodeles waltl TaxID=8319 RepID=A0AAV7TJ85_PLEWA|nr:hypothetical protein NDU88_001784 [Pleurodeles waltl]
MEVLQCRIRVTGTRRVCGPGLGRSGVTKREQRWAERRRVGRHDNPAADTGGGKPARKAQTRPDQSYKARAELGGDAECWMPVSASRWGRGYVLLAATEACNSPDCSRGGDDPAAEIGRGKPTGKAPAGPDRSYEARAELGRGEESRAPVSDSG